MEMKEKIGNRINTKNELYLIGNQTKWYKN